MKHLQLRCFLIFFLCLFHNKTIDCKTSFPNAIFALDPLSTGHTDATWLQTYVPYVQQAALPLAACFFCAIKRDNIYTDIINNPYTSALILYITFQYGFHTINEYQQAIIDAQTKDTLQQTFYLLIIGHGIRNSILQKLDPIKTSVSSININLDELEFFLHKTHNLWISLFSEYNATYKHQSIFIYSTDQIGLFEMLQASSHDHDLMNLIVHNHLMSSSSYDYQAILKLLEQKFMRLSHKSIKLNSISQ